MADTVSEIGGNRRPSDRHWMAPTMLLRLALILLVPILVITIPLVIYETVPQTAGDLHYVVRINRLTGTACLIFENQDYPPTLREFAC